jgi:single-strand DNA-binding protein
MNHGVLYGRLTKDIELITTKNGKIVGKSSIACNDKYDKEKSHFFNFTAFGKTAETMSKYLEKGSAIIIGYSLSQNRWETQDGQKRSSVDLIVNEFTFTEKGNKSNSQKNAAASDPDFEQVDDDNEAPF